MQEQIAEKVWLYPGSFDPFTLGHLSIVEQASLHADKLIIAILQHPLKKSVFSVAERITIIKESVRHLKNVEVVADTCLLVNLYSRLHATAIVRGVRNFRDWEYERDYALANQHFIPDCQFVYLAAPANLTHVSSSLVRELLAYDENVSKLLAPNVGELVTKMWHAKS